MNGLNSEKISNFNSKLPELRSTVDTNNSDIVIVSEANFDLDDQDKYDEREKIFPDYNFIDKEVTGNRKARLTLMVKKPIKFGRISKYEDNENSTATIRVKDGHNKWLYIMGI